ncbi:MAG: NifU family protein [Bernardetiaceae bacterium]|nr:NifU family protein [Bernardetiaceae bacterium]
MSVHTPSKTSEKPLVHIYVESNPNPEAMKFVCNFMLIREDPVFDYPNVASAQNSPLATALFENFDFVSRVFMSKNFITITKTPEQDWIELISPLRQFLTQYFEDQKPIFSDKIVAELEDKAEAAVRDTPEVTRIKQILDEYIRPAVDMDGGAISFHSFDKASGKLEVILQGSCSGCPSSTITLKAGIQNLFQNMMPQVKEVVAHNQ